MNKYSQIIKFLSTILLIIPLYKCGTYSYISEFRVTTVSINNFKNHVKTLSSTINYDITEKLQEKINNQEDLELVEKEGEIKIDGEITNYRSYPFSIGQNNVVYLNRLELKMKVKLSHINDGTNIKNISAFVDYDAKLNMGSVRDSLNAILTDRVVENIYNEFFIRW